MMLTAAAFAGHHGSIFSHLFDFVACLSITILLFLFIADLP
jgi:hypothetical protein